MDSRWIEDQSIPTLHMKLDRLAKEYQWNLADNRLEYSDTKSDLLWVSHGKCCSGMN